MVQDEVVAWSLIAWRLRSFLTSPPAINDIYAITYGLETMAQLPS